MKKLFLKKICTALTAILVLSCFLSACGPEPGREGTGGEADGGTMFGQGPAEEGSTDPLADGTDRDAEETGSADREATGAAAGAAAENAGSGTDAAAQTASAAAGVSRIPADMESMTEEDLAVLQDYLNEESSYGFLLSSYEKPQEIDLNQVFYSGAGYPQAELRDREKELLLERIPQDELRTPVVKVTQDQIEELLNSKAGISSEESACSFEEMEDWAHIGRYDAWYALRGDTNRMYVTCTDGWRQESLYVVHYTLSAEDPRRQTETEAEAAKEEEAAAGDTTESAAESARESTAERAGETSAAASTAAEAGGETSAAATAAAAERAGETSAAATAAAAEAPAADTSAPEALYQPVYEVRLQETAGGWQFCSNTLWVQRDMIEAQSYRAELSPVGEVFFAPFLPETKVDERADVTFALVKDRALLACLSPMEKGNIRTDRIFTGLDAVDFTDCNGDGFTDILTIATYTRIGEDGRKTGDIREARVYTGQADALPYLDEKKTAAVNRNVETLNITNVAKYLAGKSDGKTVKYNSWKEAFAAHVQGLPEEEYQGFALINLNDDSTPELVQMGATDAKGATIVVYRGGLLEETWLNRRNFQYLEYENLLYSASGVENLHYDTIYSIVGGRLGISVQGYYGNSRFAAVQCAKDGQEVYDYYWDGGQVSQNGYRDGITFVFDLSRARTCDAETLLSGEEILEKLK